VATPSETIEPEHRFVVTREYVSSATREVWLFSITRRATIVKFVLLLALATAIAAIATTFVPSELGPYWMLGGVVIVGGCSIAGGVIGARIQIARSLRKQLPIGATLASGFGERSFLVEAPLSRSIQSYETYKDASERNGIVILRHSAHAFLTVLPSELFPPDALVRFHGAD